MHEFDDIPLSLNIDWHVHGPCSCDSTIDPIQACKVAENKGLDGLCFTEHIDFDPRDMGYQFFNWNIYLDFINAAKNKFPKMNIFTGMELNWQKEFSGEIMQFLEGKQVDFLLGSVHWVSSGHTCDEPTFEALSKEEFMDEWISEAIDLLRQDLCQGFAHFDYFMWKGQIYYDDLNREDIFETTRDIIDLMIKKNVSLEINTSALRKGFKEPFPSWDFIQKYVKIGGTRVHLGSDAHSRDQIGFRFKASKKRLRNITTEFQ